MALTITAQLTDPSGKPIASLEAQALTFNAAGTARVIGNGRSGPDGALTIPTSVTPTGDLQARVQLCVKRGSGFVEASENPVTYTATLCDFGRVALPKLIRTAPRPMLVDQADLEELQGQVTTLSQAKVSLERQVETTLAEQQAARMALEQSHTLALKAKDNDIAKRDAQLLEARKQIEALQASEVRDTALGDLAQSAAEQLERAQSTLREGRSGFRLGTVSLQLKVLPGSADGRVGLPKVKDIERVGAAALGQIQMELRPEAPAVALATVQVPSLVGDTERAARRRLADRRLRIDVLFQLADNPADLGRVILQSPAAEAIVPEDSLVTVAIGKGGEL